MYQKKPLQLNTQYHLKFTETKDYNDAKKLLKLCEDNSSGAEDKLASLTNKTQRWTRAKKEMYSPQHICNQSDDSEQDEKKNYYTNAAKALSKLMPDPPGKNLISSKGLWIFSK